MFRLSISVASIQAESQFLEASIKADFKARQDQYAKWVADANSVDITPPPMNFVRNSGPCLEDSLNLTLLIWERLDKLDDDAAAPDLAEWEEVRNELGLELRRKIAARIRQVSCDVVIVCVKPCNECCDVRNMRDYVDRAAMLLCTRTNWNTKWMSAGGR